jgi:glycosyltransferase involved in cell wall biosynthesis
VKVALLTPWPNVWVPFFQREIEKRGHQFKVFRNDKAPSDCDVTIHGWTMGQPMPGTRNIVFMRAFEIYEDRLLENFHWPAVDHVICVSPFLASILRQWLDDHKYTNIPISVIPNACDTSAWTFKERTFNGKLGMACHVHWKKNLPLALQICAALPEGTSLHIAGEMQDRATMMYLHEASNKMRRRVVLSGHIPHEQMDSWWDQFGVCLSTSVREGNPNNVLETMAKGIKPVIHCWPGSEFEFQEDWIFKTVDEAVKIIQGPTDSKAYRAYVEEHYSLRNIAKVVDIALQTEKREAA